jgi:cytochrome c oxidase assembly protein subunit 15
MKWLHRYTVLVSASTLVLILAGGMVTSTGSGLSVPDWPTTYGYNMFTFPYQSWVGGIFYEHGHRLIATTVGILTIGLAVWLWLCDPRRWMRWLGVVGLVAVTAQGVLGGLTVLYFLPAPISIGHAGLAQIFFCITVGLALFTSRGWLAPAAAPSDDRTLRRLAVATTLIVFAQILLGATMRHTGAGLAIPDFPLAFGRLLPPSWTPAIAIHFAHRLWAVVAVAAIFAAAGHVWHHHPARRDLTRPAWLLSLAALVQFTLGAFVVLTGREPTVNSAHVAVGSLVLATSLVLALRTYRVRFCDASFQHP